MNFWILLFSFLVRLLLLFLGWQCGAIQSLDAYCGYLCGGFWLLKGKRGIWGAVFGRIIGKYIRRRNISFDIIWWVAVGWWVVRWVVRRERRVRISERKYAFRWSTTLDGSRHSPSEGGRFTLIAKRALGRLHIWSYYSLCMQSTPRI